MKLKWVVLMIGLLGAVNSGLAIANQGSGGAPAMPIYRCMVENEQGKVTESWVPLHICQQKGGKSVI